MRQVVIGHTDKAALKVDLPRLFDTRMLIQANSGGGKSWLLRLLVERAAKHVQVIILDPEGEFATLREKVDLALVGAGGELATDLRSAALLARKLVELSIPAIVDLYDLKLAERRQYVRLFLEALMSVPRAHWHPLLIILDEAHLFAPERSAGEAESTDAVIALMSQGRKRGFAGILTTQRISKLHKDAAAEANNVVIGRTWLDNDQVRAGDLLGFPKAERLLLRDMAPGEFYAFGPALNADGVVRFQSDPVETTHPKAGQRHKLTVPQASAAIQDVVQQVGDLPAQAEKETKDLAAAQKRVAELERELRARPVQVKPETVERRIEIPVFKDGEVARLEAAVGQLAGVGTLIQGAASEVSGAIRAFAARPALPIAPPRPVIVTKTTRPATAPRPAGDADANLPRGERLVLEALIQYPAGLRRDQITVITGYKRSTRDAYIQRLREKGYAADGERVTATEAGFAALPDANSLPTGEALQAHWLSRLPQGERVILTELISAYPDSVERNSLTDLTGYKRSTRDAYLQRLAAKELVTDMGSSQVRASETLFDGDMP